MRFAGVNVPHYTFTMLHKEMQVKHESVQVYAERLYALTNDAFTKVDKAIVELQLVRFFTDWLYHDFLHMKVMRKNPKKSGCSTVCIDRTKFVEEFSIKVK